MLGNKCWFILYPNWNGNRYQLVEGILKPYRRLRYPYWKALGHLVSRERVNKWKSILPSWLSRVLFVSRAINTGFPKGAPEGGTTEDASFGGPPLLGVVVWGPNPISTSVKRPQNESGISSTFSLKKALNYEENSFFLKKVLIPLLPPYVKCKRWKSTRFVRKKVYKSTRFVRKKWKSPKRQLGAHFWRSLFGVIKWSCFKMCYNV